MEFSSSSEKTGGSLFFNGSSANILIIVTILVIGTITILSVSDENIMDPMHIMIQVKIVVQKESIAYVTAYFLILYLTKT